MRSADVVVLIDVFAQYGTQMFFVENDQVIQTFLAKCADDTFGDRILPRTSWRSRRIFQAKVPDVLFEIITEYFVVVMDNIFDYFVESKCFTKLLNSLLRVRVCSNRKVPYFPPIV